MIQSGDNANADPDKLFYTDGAQSEAARAYSGWGIPDREVKFLSNVTDEYSLRERLTELIGRINPLGFHESTSLVKKRQSTS